jgi:uncharacterized protein (TIGR00251 family)
LESTPEHTNVRRPLAIAGIVPEEKMKLVEKDGAVRFEVWAKPKSKKSQILGVRDAALEVALAAMPVDGAANEELVRLLAKTLGITKRDVVLVRGDSSRGKLVAVTGLTLAEVEARLRAVVVP